MSGCDKIKLGSMIVSSFLSANALAGLGDLQVKSHLGEPFQADINLVGFSVEELDNARIALAGETEVRDPDLYSSRFLSSLRFTLLSSDQGGMIHISSNQPIDEAYLRFAIKIEALSKWQVREYTAILSPNTAPATSKPVADAQLPVAQAVPVPVVAPPAAPAATAVQVSMQPPTPPVMRSEPASPPAAASKPETKQAAALQQIRASRGASLWRLARQLKPANTSINQTMAALYLANKHAFVGGNPNRLRQGALLQLPETSRIKAVSKGQIDKILHSDKLPAKTKFVLKPASKPSGKTADKPAIDIKQAPVGKPASAQPSTSHDDLRIEELQKKLHSIDEALTKMDGLNKRIEKLQQQLKN
ncbi:hypothetical protein DBR44_12860 [Aquitalea sp. FJL05]|nr:hypothetical protein DBR44_12860 [Aquitalea sp. FJL05]